MYIYLVPGTWCQIPCTKYKDTGTCHRYLVPSTWYKVLGSKYLFPSTWYRPHSVSDNLHTFRILGTVHTRHTLLAKHTM